MSLLSDVSTCKRKKAEINETESATKGRRASADRNFQPRPSSPPDRPIESLFFRKGPTWRNRHENDLRVLSGPENSSEVCSLRGKRLEGGKVERQLPSRPLSDGGGAAHLSHVWEIDLERRMLISFLCHLSRRGRR